MAEILEILEKLNPWWVKSEFSSGIEREKYSKRIMPLLESGEIIVISGVRRAGKTTLMHQAIKYLLEKNINPKQILFANFDEADISTLKNPIKDTLEIFYNEIAEREKKTYLFFDEVQSVDGWEKWAKTIYDEKKSQIIISGSSSYLLSGNLAKLIGGRYISVNVFPLDFEEYLKFNNILMHDKIEQISKKSLIIKKLKEYLKEGGYPRVILEKNKKIKEELLKNYFESIVLKDIILMKNVRNEKLLKELIYFFASNIASPYSYKNLSKSLSADFSTIKEYIGFIENSRTFYEIPFFSYSLKSQNRNEKKAYCIDNGIRNAISFKFMEDYGKLAENLVFIELLRREKEIYYWKNENGYEVDFVIKNKDNSLSGINVTFSDEIKEREIRSLNAFISDFKKARELIILTKNIEKIENKIKYIPLWKWLLEKY